MSTLLRFAATAAALAALGVNAQTYQRLGTCPTLGCVFPPDQADFLPGQNFDLRVEVHAPVNGSEAFNNGVADEKFTLTIQREHEKSKAATTFFSKTEPALEKWTFSYYEDLFNKRDNKPTVVNVASKIYRQVALYTPGTYTVTLTYYGKQTTVATWFVRKPVTDPKHHKAKNVLFFIGDGMTISMQTAARLLAHKTINGKYQSLLQMDQMEALGHQMTHSIDSYITDSANSATALQSGHKSTVNALNVYADSSPDPFDDPKIETLAEIFHRVRKGIFGFVSTAFIADATPAAMVAHTRSRGQYADIVDMYLHGMKNYSWPSGAGAEVIFGGGAEQFIPGSGTLGGKDYYKEFQNAGYQVAYDNTGMQKLDNKKKALGIFSVSNMAKWLDRQVYKGNLLNQKNHPTGDKTDAVDQPGLKEMTLKAIDILATRSKAQGNNGWYLMSEAASIDKMMHVLDYNRALGELLELDDTIRASIAHLKKLGIYEDTLIVVTADHGHGFDVFGGVDTKFLAASSSDREKRAAVGVYAESGLSGYTVPPGTSPQNNTVVIGAQGPNFPVQWDPRYAIAAGTVNFPDHRENYTMNVGGPRVPAKVLDAATGNEANPADAPNGFHLDGNLPVGEAQGVHSLTDVAVYANGPGAEQFRGVYSAIDIFFKMADALGLATYSNTTHH
ncbi:putative alkaline phosphatase [Auriculariales sp. MPI-PUGE-AT-0066]|nr:putative alkaline phosphatase [Auriculariales sp. MPI-PUGE-AT-0066]